MPRRNRRDEPEDEDDWDDDELPDGVYYDDDDGEPTVKCPYCGNEVVETAQYCPRCENYISKEDAPRESKTSFWTMMMLMALLAAMVATLFIG